ncbi:MAG: STAS-like domain-containing protein [Burkholderiales bacterium]|nr:STAS-like domain-containing protein [Burkholderiales bacterium]
MTKLITMQQVNINVFNAIGDSYCVYSEDGEILYNLITKALRENHQTKLSFQNIEMVGVAFLNSAIGQYNVT